MKKQGLKLMISAMVCGLVIAGCGGGGGKNNRYLGALPSIYAKFEAAEKADKDKFKKLESSGDFVKMAKEAMKMEKEEKARRDKFEADKAAEIPKLAGIEIPFSHSKAFLDQSLNYEVATLKVSDKTTQIQLAFTTTIKQDFTIDRNNKDPYEYLHYRAVAKDGSTINVWSVMLLYVNWGETKSFTKGKCINEKNWTLVMNLEQSPEKWVDFASIEFITGKEYQQYSKK